MKKLLDIIFSKKEKNPFFVKLEKVLSRQDTIRDIKKIFYLGGFPYSKIAYENLEKAISDNELDGFLKEARYDVQKDNLEIYWVEERLGNTYVLVLLDPEELYQQEEILKIILYTKKLPNDLMTEEIYSV